MRHFNKAKARYPGLWSGCVGAWGLLDQAGSVAIDYSDCNRNGVMTNYPIPDQLGVINNRYMIKGDGVDSYTVMPVPQTVFESPYSLSVRYYSSQNETGTDKGIISSGATPTTGFPNVLIQRATSTTIRFYVNAAYRNTVTITNGVMYALTATWDGGTHRFYVNGALSGTSVGGVTTYANASLYLGSGYNGYTQNYVGDVMLHRRALTENEIGLLSSRHGIAYEMTRDRHYKSAAGFRPHWASQRTQIISGGTR